MPGLARGTVWLSRFRTHSVSTQLSRAKYLKARFPESEDARKWEAYILRPRCSQCNVLLNKETEWAHHLVVCRTHKEVRNRIFKQYLPQVKVQAGLLVDEGLQMNVGLVDLTAALLLGANIGESKAHFTSAFGHDPKVVLDEGCAFRYGYVLTALFLQETMSHYMTSLFSESGIGVTRTGYVSASQTDLD